MIIKKIILIIIDVVVIESQLSGLVQCVSSYPTIDKMRTTPIMIKHPQFIYLRVVESIELSVFT